jgi:hypothetical protein
MQLIIAYRIKDQADEYRISLEILRQLIYYMAHMAEKQVYRQPAEIEGDHIIILCQIRCGQTQLALYHFSGVDYVTHCKYLRRCN